MPTFETLQPTKGLDFGRVPNVDIGAGYVEQGMNKLAAGLSEAGAYAERYQQIQKQKDTADTALRFEDHNQQLALQHQQLVQNQAPGAEGLAQAGVAATDKANAEFLKTVPPELQQQYALRLKTLGDQYHNGYAQAEYAGRTSWEKEQTLQRLPMDATQAMTSWQQSRDMGQVDTVLKNRLDQIDTLTIMPAEKEILKQQAKSTIYGAVAKSMTPDEARKYLGPYNDPAKPAAGADGAAPSFQAPTGGHLSRGIRNNNFGNIESGPWAAKQPGYVGSDGRFARFASPADGINAMSALLNNYGNRGLNTVQKVVGTWAPAKDHNDVVAYAASVSKTLGIDPNTPLNMADHGQRVALAQAMAQVENGRKIDFGALPQHPVLSPQDAADQGGHYRDPMATPTPLTRQQPAAPSYTPPDPRFAMFTPEERQSMFNSVLSQNAQDRGATVSLIKDDLASTERTGVGVQGLTEDRVRTMLGEQAATDWTQQRALAKRFHDATGDMSQLPPDMVAQKIASLAPVPGQPGYVDQENAYARAQAMAADAMKMRQQDPAGSVEKDPAVAAAKLKANMAQPASYADLVAARLAAQTKIGIPDGMQSPMSLTESDQFSTILKQALPGHERDVLKQVISSMQALYGDHTGQAISYMLSQAKMDAPTKAITASIFRKLGLGQPVTQEDAKTLDDAQKTAAADQAVAGVVGPQAQQAQRPVPSYQALQYLRANPDTAPKFDAIYGPGVAATVLTFDPKAHIQAAPTPPETPQTSIPLGASGLSIPLTPDEQGKPAARAVTPGPVTEQSPLQKAQDQARAIRKAAGFNDGPTP